jgi:hypothetical protein
MYHWAIGGGLFLASEEVPHKYATELKVPAIYNGAMNNDY